MTWPAASPFAIAGLPPCPRRPGRTAGLSHAGSSDGHINNDYYQLYDIPTIFNVLDAQGKSWGVFHDTAYMPSLTFGQFMPQLLRHDAHFHQYQVFRTLCQAGATAAPD